MDWYKKSNVDLEQRIKILVPQMVTKSQSVYDAWDQDEDGIDVWLGCGGICQDIADGICDVLTMNGIDCTSVSAQVGEQHVWAIAYEGSEAFDLDIHPGNYETGGGYNWKKIPGVVFTTDMVSIERNSFFDPEDEDY
jgi:hypothetical protein